MKELVFSFKHAGVGAGETSALMTEYTQLLRETALAGAYNRSESSICLPTNRFADEAKAMVDAKNTVDLKYVIVVGIGGSNLGTEAVYKAMYRSTDFLVQRRPKLIFLDTVSPTLMADVLALMDALTTKEEVLVNVISKSGGTTETVAHFECLHAHLAKKFGEVNDRFVLTTDEDSKLWNVGKERNIATLSLPAMVGGRFSVFTNVGLFPLALAGIDVEVLLRGAEAMRDRCLEGDNVALRSAEIMHAHALTGVRIHNSFFFNPELEWAGKWYRQLVGESIAKQHDVNGVEVRAGITPIVSIGSTDLHSMVQLYLGGPKDKFTQFVYASQPDVDVRVPQEGGFGLVSGIDGRVFAEIMDAIYEGTKAAYEEHTLPYAEIDMRDVSEYSIGQYMQYKMLEIMYLAQLMNVNAFDQPNVEDYKVVTKRVLEG